MVSRKGKSHQYEIVHQLFDICNDCTNYGDHDDNDDNGYDNRMIFYNTR